MAKKGDMTNIKNLGKGILDSLQGMEEESTDITEEKSNDVKEEKSNTVKNTKGEKEPKSKRSFMLKETTIHKLSLLKLCMNDKDLSTIVEEAIDMYFDKNKESIEALVEIYNKVK